MADPSQQSTPPSIRTTAAAQNVPTGEHPLNDPDNLFTVLEMSQSPSHEMRPRSTATRSQPHTPPNPDQVAPHESVDYHKKKPPAAQTQSIAQVQSILNGKLLRWYVLTCVHDGFCRVRLF